MADPDTDDLRDIAASLATSTRQLNDAAERIAEIMPSSNAATITVQAGGLSAGFAAALAAASICLMLICSMWLMLKMHGVESKLETTRQDLQDQQAAWVSVMQQRVNEARKQ